MFESVEQSTTEKTAEMRDFELFKNSLKVYSRVLKNRYLFANIGFLCSKKEYLCSVKEYLNI